MTGQRRIDLQFVRMLMKSHALGAVLRLRERGEAPFRDKKDDPKLLEDLLQHCAMMSILALLLRVKARDEGDNYTTALDFEKLSAMIYLHDLEELIIGDAKDKTPEYMVSEVQARDKIHAALLVLPFGGELVELCREYLEKRSPEARFVKALDEVQAWAYMLAKQRTDATTRDLCKPAGLPGYEFAKEFTTLWRVSEILREMVIRRQLRHQAREG